MRPQPQPSHDCKTNPPRTSLRSGDTMGLGGGARPQQTQSAARPHQGLTSVSLFCYFYFPSLYTQDSVHQRPCPAANPPNSRCNSQGGKKAATNTQVVSITSIKFDYIHQSAAHPWRGTCLISPIPCLPHYLYHSALIAEFLE